MLLEVIKQEGGEDIARGDIYKNGVLLHRYKMYFKEGVLQNASIGKEYAVTLRWLEKLYNENKLAYIEL